MKDPNWRKCLLNADSRDILKRIPDNSIDFILTDPPYNLSKHSTGNINIIGRSAMNNDVADWDMVDFNPEEWADEFIRILKPTGNLFIFTSYNQLGRWYNCLDHKFDTSNFMIWHKTNPAPKIFKAGFLNSCEMIFVCWNKKHTWNFISQKEMHNFLESPICMRPERLSNPKHPTQKPVSILKKMIRIATNENDIIFDPFMGVGSTGVAAFEMNRRFIGVELDGTYFKAAKKRIEEQLNYKYMNLGEDAKTVVNEDLNLFNYDIRDNFRAHKKDEIDDFFNLSPNPKMVDARLQPIIKWPGGKEKELKYIIPNLPLYKRFFEPFVGGGSVFMAMNAKEYYINDLSTELIELYRNIADSNKEFFGFARVIDDSWNNAETFFKSNAKLVDKYISYRNNVISKEELRAFIHEFCMENEPDILNILDNILKQFPCVLLNEMEKNLFRKMVRMKVLEIEKHLLSVEDLNSNILTAIKSAVYMNYRELYNNEEVSKNNPILHCALFFFIRNYAYSGMFRYGKNGNFNVPYGGIAYNNKFLLKKINYFLSQDLLRHFKNTKIYNSDFEDFLKCANPNEDDFIFLDPPYDSEFSTYAKNDFDKNDQIRLAFYLINECKAKWMMIIKNTDFIYNLYNQKGINIKTFDKEYLVSFMNRNDKKVTHLLITNY